MRRVKIILVILVVGLTVLGSLISIKRHERFESQGWDLGLYDQIVWLYSQGEAPYSTLVERLDPTDRFRPILLLTVPFYWLKLGVKTLLVIQAVVLSLGMVPAFWLAKKKLKNEWVALMISLAYGLFIGIQSFLLDDFHEVAFLPALILWFFHDFLARKDKRWIWPFILTLMVREHVGLLMGVVGFYLWLTTRRKKEALVVMLGSWLWAGLIIKLVMPSFGEFSYGTFDQLINNYLTNPGEVLKMMVTPVIKLKTVFWSFLGFGFLPFLEPMILLPIGFQFASRFLDTIHPYRWGAGLHFSGELASLMVVGIILGLEKVKNKKLIWVLIVGVLVEQLFFPVSWKNLIKKDFWKQESWMENNREVIKLIPEDDSVATQNNLTPHLSQRKEIYVLPSGMRADWIMVDLRKQQDGWNFYTLSLEEVKKITIELTEKGEYEIWDQRGDAVLLKKTKARVNDPKK